MEWFTILVFSLLAEGILAGNCNDNQKVNITLLTDTFLEGIKPVAVPTIEFGDNATKLKEQFATVGVDYCISLTKLMYDRSQEIGNEFINAVNEIICKLQKCCASLTDHSSPKPNCLESILTSLTDQFNQFLELIPGNVFFKRKALPELPPRPDDIVSKTSERPPADIFLNLAKTIDDDFKAFFEYTIIIHLEGYKAARTQFNNLQSQFRNEILNDRILKAYRSAVDIALGLNCKIEENVNPETWQNFNNTCNRIISISDDYNASKNDQNCS